MKNDQLRLLGVYKDKVFCGPKVVRLSIIDFCNLSCSYCWYHSDLYGKKKKHSGFMDFKTYRKIINELQELGAEKIVYGGEGEPFMHPEIRKMIEITSEKGLELEIQTNGTFDRGMVNSMAKVRKMKFNFCAATPESYSLQCKNNAEKVFSSVLENIKNACRIRDVAGNPRVELIYVITERNYADVERYLKLASKLNVNWVRFKVFNENYNPIKTLNLTEKSKEKLIEIIKTALKNKEAGTVSNNLEQVLEILANSPKKSLKQSFKENLNSLLGKKQEMIVPACYAGWYVSTIDLNGDVSLCCMSCVPLGNISKKSFKEVWESKKYQKARLKGKYDFDTRDKLWRKCKVCVYESINWDADKKLRIMKKVDIAKVKK